MTTATVDRTKLYGILHELNGQAIEKRVRVLKVGIGVPAGPDMHVWIDVQGQWCVETVAYPNGKRQVTVQRFANREKAETVYRQQRKDAPERKAPRTIPYFTFLRKDAQGQFVHDFDAIEKHGALPTELDIVFLNDNTFDAAFQAWSTSKLLCEGNGRDALRHIEWAQTPEEKVLAQKARDNGQKVFPIIDGCYAKGCPLARGEQPKCKPHGSLYFQLVNALRIGGSCQFDTTGYRSIEQISSSLLEIRTLTGRGNPNGGTASGIPLKLVMRPYRVRYKEKISTQYGLSVEFRANSMADMTRLLTQRAGFRPAPELPVASPPGGETLEDSIPVSEEDAWMMEESDGAALSGEAGVLDVEDAERIEAAAMSAEFYGDFEPGDDVPVSTSSDAEVMPRRRSDTRPH